MLGPLEDLLADPGSAAGEENRALVEVAHRNALRLLKLVNSLLDFSRLEAGRARANFERVDLAVLTAELAANFRSAAERAGLKFEVDGKALNAPVYVDRDMWEKVVLNLLSNAFKFTLEGTIHVAVKMSADRKAAELPSRTRAPAFRPIIYRSYSSASTRSAVKKAGPLRAPASGSRW